MMIENMDKTVVLVALFAAVIGAGLNPKITLISGVPITAQSLGLLSVILGARAGAQRLLFLGLTALGLPFGGGDQF